MKRQRGMTITSLLVAMAVGLILVAAMLSAFTLSVRSGTDVRRAARLNQDLRVVMERMVSDIRRAGYWGAATSFEWGVTENPFTAATTDIAIDELTGEDADSCIVFSYDFDQDGVVDYDGEGFGFRLNAGEVDVRSSTTGAGAMGCTGGTWEPLTDPDVVTIDGLSFRVLADRDDATSPASQCLNTSTGAGWESLCSDTVWCNASNCVTAGEVDYTAPASGNRLVETRLVEITLSGVLVDDTAVRKQLREYVKVRNNRMILTP